MTGLLRTALAVAVILGWVLTVTWLVLAIAQVAVVHTTLGTLTVP